MLDILNQIDQKAESLELFYVEGEVESDERSIVIINNNYASARILSEDIEWNNTILIGNHKNVNGARKKYLVAIKKGAEVELKYKSCTHKFILDIEKERPFYIDQEREEVVFLDDVKQTSDDCQHYIILFYAECCEGGGRVESYGLAGCNSGFNHRDCC